MINKENWEQLGIAIYLFFAWVAIASFKILSWLMPKSGKFVVKMFKSWIIELIEESRNKDKEGDQTQIVQVIKVVIKDVIKEALENFDAAKISPLRHDIREISADKDKSVFEPLFEENKLLAIKIKNLENKIK